MARCLALAMILLAGVGCVRRAEGPATADNSEAKDQADKERIVLKHRYLGTEHLLLGVVSVHEGKIPKILARLRLNRTRVRDGLYYLLGAEAAQPGDPGGRSVADELVPEAAIDYAEVFRRGGRNHGDEDFAFFRCPHCRRVYLLEYEVDTVYLDPIDLSRRAPVHNDEFVCVACGQQVPSIEPWIGQDARPDFRATWTDLFASGWGWAVRLSDQRQTNT